MAQGSLSRTRKFVFYVVMIALTAAVCFVIVEYLFSRYYYSSVSESAGVEFDPLLGWKLGRGTYWVKPNYNFKRHKLYINSLGLRNDELTDEMRKNCRLIIFLGDSFTHGRQTREEDLFTNHVGAIIDRLFPQKGYRVVNAGVPGYGTAQQLLLMSNLAEEKGIVGDIYVVMVFTNDILDNLGVKYGDLEEMPQHPRFALNDEGALELVHLPEELPRGAGTGGARPKRYWRFKFVHVVKARMEGFLQTKPGLVRLLNKVGIRATPSRIPGFINGWYRDDVLDEGVPLMRALLGEMKNRADRYGAKLLVSFIPSMIQVYPDTYGPMLKRTFPDDEIIDYWLEDLERPQRLIGRMCEEMNIPFHDLYPAFYENNSRDFYIPRDGHLNKNGHLIVAEEVAGFIAQHAE